MGSLVPKSERAYEMPSRRKEERSRSGDARGSQMVAGKSEVRNKSQSKSKQEESSEELSSNCGGRKGMDSIVVFMGTIADHSRRWQQ